MRTALLLAALLAPSLAGCAWMGAEESCSFDLYEHELAPGEKAGNVTQELLARWPTFAEALARPHLAGGSVPCDQHVRMMEDVLGLGGTGRVEDERHGHALIEHEGRTLRVVWTFAHGGTV